MFIDFIDNILNVSNPPELCLQRPDFLVVRPEYGRQVPGGAAQPVQLQIAALQLPSENSVLLVQLLRQCRSYVISSEWYLRARIWYGRPYVWPDIV